MLIVGLNGSPNPDGNTKQLLREVLDKAESLGAATQLIEAGGIISALEQPFCTVCTEVCTGICYEDTPLADAFALMQEADGIVFGSPVYFGTVTAQLKAIFDKSRLLRRNKAFYNKVAAGVTVGASRFGGQETTMKALHDIMLVQGMIIVGDGYGEDDCGHHGVSAAKPAQEDANARKRAGILAKRLVEVCEATMVLRSSSEELAD